VSSALVHIVGMYCRINDRLRQRCTWCGAVLIDVDTANMAVPEGQEGGPGTWPVGALVRVDGNLTYVVDHVDGDPLPEDACGRLDPEVTV
jgi:hypothetical protein